MKFQFALIFWFFLAHGSHIFAAEPAALWQDVADGKNMIMLRHALAPGTGDPENFALRQCNTQRNLSEKGRQQARQIGANFKAHGIKDAKVYSSQWCRCLDTATEMNIGATTELPLLNSFYGNPETGPAQINRLTQWLVEQSKDNINQIVLVTHQVVITALTGVYPASGDAVIFRITEKKEVEVLGKIAAEL